MINRLRQLGSAVQKVLADQSAEAAGQVARGLEQGLAELEAEMARLRRVAVENHGLIEQVLKQRDYWCEKWKLHGVQHSNAQSQLLQQIESLDSAIASRLLPELNKYREKEGLKPLLYTSALERFRTLFGDYKTTLAASAAEGDAMPNDFIERRQPVDPEK